MLLLLRAPQRLHLIRLCPASLPASCSEVFSPLVEKCKSLNRAMRIGTNHGSLSARILSFYGAGRWGWRARGGVRACAAGQAVDG